MGVDESVGESGVEGKRRPGPVPKKPERAAVLSDDRTMVAEAEVLCWRWGQCCAKGMAALVFTLGVDLPAQQRPYWLGALRRSQVFL
jgi:hypothetical protein